MKQILSEELKRIHEITYGKKIIEEQDFLNNILKWFFPKKDDPNFFLKCIGTFVL